MAIKSKSKSKALKPNRRVLFVDDEPMVLEAMQRQVGEIFDVHTATSGNQGLAILKSGIKFAIIVADMRMPGMDGIEFLMQAKDIDPDAVPMMLTGNADRQTAVDAIEMGQVFHFLTKPCNRERMVKSLEDGLQLYMLRERIDTINCFLEDVA